MKEYELYENDYLVESDYDFDRIQKRARQCSQFDICEVKQNKNILFTCKGNAYKFAEEVLDQLENQSHYDMEYTYNKLNIVANISYAHTGIASPNAIVIRLIVRVNALVLDKRIELKIKQGYCSKKGHIVLSPYADEVIKENITKLAKTSYGAFREMLQVYNEDIIESWFNDVV